MQTGKSRNSKPGANDDGNKIFNEAGVANKKESNDSKKNSCD